MRKVAVIGSGSWGTAMTGLVAPSVDEVVQWALEPDIVESINTRHHNARYLVDYEMAPNVRATSSME
ncbi:MAG: NAD(P)H-dependent glycerol-3-phosphate dehydrogenase, partial [Olsenella sp.]